MWVDTHWPREKNPNFVMWDYKQHVVLDSRMHYQFVCIFIDPPFVTSKVGPATPKATLLLLKYEGIIILSTILENLIMFQEMLKVEA